MGGGSERVLQGGRMAEQERSNLCVCVYVFVLVGVCVYLESYDECGSLTVYQTHQLRACTVSVCVCVCVCTS